MKKKYTVLRYKVKVSNGTLGYNGMLYEIFEEIYIPCYGICFNDRRT